MLIFEGNTHKKIIGVISQLGAEKITFPPKQMLTYGHTDGHLLL